MTDNDERVGGVAVGATREGRPADGRRSRAAWSVLAYLAGDNNLEDSLLEDLREMERVGSRPGSVEILAQLDRPRGARRYYITRSTKPTTIGSKVLADFGPTNTGDPRVLKAFVNFGAKRYPAQATLLILSNHGSGFYVPPLMLSKERERPRRAAYAARGVQRTVFRTSRERLLMIDSNRGLAYDDGSGDCLDNRELTTALADAHRVLGRPVDIVGMDACLMTMLEVAYQVRDHARILVGSEDLEPGAGWPYTSVLGELTSRPTMTAPELATTIVRRYAASYEGSREQVTQSAIDLTQLDDLVGAADALARALLAALPNRAVEASIYGAWRGSVRFFDNLYVDLHHLATNLSVAVDRTDVRAACADVRRAMDARPGPILAAAHVGRRLSPTRGLSIFFPPFRDRSIFYRELAFARQTRWADFLDAYLGKA